MWYMNNLSFSVKSYFCRFIKQQIYSYYMSFHSSHFSDLKARSLNFEPEASALKHCLCNVVEDFDQVNSNKLKSLEKMSVLIVTSLGDIVVDLYSEKCPLTAKNFLKLCKIKYYNGCLFHTVQKDFTAQTGDPTGTGSGGDSIYKFLYGEQARFFSDEIHLDLKHAKTGTLAMASAGENLNASQFYFTLRDDLDYLDGKHVVFGEIAEGLETLTRINEAFTDEKGRPFKNIRIKHTYILDDPFEDPPQISEFIPDASPEGKPKDEVEDEVRLEDDWVPMDEQMDVRELEEVLRSKEAHSRAVVLETIGDIPDAEIKPPENVLFVCKLNPVTEDEDLHTIFSRFGTVTSAEVIRDFKTGDSLCYAFIEFETDDACEQAYFKMDNALIDDRRIHVDFSQSVSKLWSQYRRKSHQTGSGKGCFKCGETDHIAKDCGSEGTKMKKEEKKYVVKNDDRQRGGRENSRYEMVFDEDTRDSPEKQNRGRDQEERAEKRSREHPIISEDSRHKSRDKSDPRATERGRTDREHRERREKRSGERDDRDHRNTARADGNGRSDERRDDRDYRKKVSDKDDRSRDYRRSNDHRNRDENRKRNSGEDRYTRENERKEHKRREEDVTDDRDRERRYRRDDKKR